jgi:hypothetical protein
MIALWDIIGRAAWDRKTRGEDERREMNYFSCRQSSSAHCFSATVKLILLFPCNPCLMITISQTQQPGYIRLPTSIFDVDRSKKGGHRPPQKSLPRHFVPYILSYKIAAHSPFNSHRKHKQSLSYSKKKTRQCSNRTITQHGDRPNKTETTCVRRSNAQQSFSDRA